MYAIISHRAKSQPDDDLIVFLNRQEKSILSITHGFSTADHRKTRVRVFHGGKKVWGHESLDFSFLPFPLLMLKETLYNNFFLLLYFFRLQKVIALDGFSLMGIILYRILGLDLIFWVIDVVPNDRFNSKIINQIYFYCNKMASNFASQIWDLSPKFLDIKSKIYGVDYRKKTKIVPFGVWIDEVPRSKRKKNRIFFIGHLIEKQGLQHFIRIFPSILKKIPDCELVVVGGGEYKEQLVKLVKQLSLEKNIIFKGFVEEYSQVLKIGSTCDIAIAPYDISLDNFTQFADPGKIKTYLSLGLPVVMTPISWIQKDIKYEKLGRIVKKDYSNFAKQIISLLEDDAEMKHMRSRIKKYARTFDIPEIFEEALK